MFITAILPMYEFQVMLILLCVYIEDNLKFSAFDKDFTRNMDSNI